MNYRKYRNQTIAIILGMIFLSSFLIASIIYRTKKSNECFYLQTFNTRADVMEIYYAFSGKGVEGICSLMAEIPPVYKVGEKTFVFTYQLKSSPDKDTPYKCSRQVGNYKVSLWSNRPIGYSGCSMYK